MSSQNDRWKSPAWGFQEKWDARYDLGVVGAGGGASLDPGDDMGETFYVNGGSDGLSDNTGDGKSPTTAKQTITAALALCTNDKHDHIIVLNYGSNGRAAETWPIAVNKSQVHIIGVGTPNGKWPMVSPSGDTAAFSIQADRVEIANLELGAGATAGCIEIGTSGKWDCWVHHCHFAYTTATALYGVYIASGYAAPYISIGPGNIFGNGITSHGVYNNHNATNGIVVGNFFQEVGGNGIEADASWSGGRIVDNYFQVVTDDAIGTAVRLGASVTGVAVFNNIAGVNGGGKPIYEPFVQLGTGNDFAANWPDPLEYYYQFMPVGGGKMIFVNGGSDGPTDNAYAGLTPQTPKQTITAAIGVVTTGKEDVIFVLNYGSNGRAAETWPIAMATKDQFSIIGQGRHSTKWPLITATGADKSAFLFTTSDRVTLKNLNIGGTAAGAGAGILVQAGGTPWGLHVVNCQFGYEGSAGKYGISIESGGDAPYLTVEDCIFGNALTDSSILIAGNATRSWIGRMGRGNFFEPATNQICIEVTGGLTQCKIFDNYFVELSDAADGEAITLSGSSAACSVMGNKATSNDKNVPTNNAYIDGSSGTNSWGLNYHAAATGTDMGHLPA
jgi:hypothetical protein